MYSLAADYFKGLSPFHPEYHKRMQYLVDTMARNRVAGVWGNLTMEHMGDGVHLSVPIHDSSRILFPVDLTKTGGVAGDLTTKCTFVYTAKSIFDSSLTLGTSLTPIAPARPSVGEMTSADSLEGLCYIDADGTFLLYYAPEVETVAAC